MLVAGALGSKWRQTFPPFYGLTHGCLERSRLASSFSFHHEFSKTSLAKIAATLVTGKLLSLSPSHSPSHLSWHKICFHNEESKRESRGKGLEWYCDLWIK